MLSADHRNTSIIENLENIEKCKEEEILSIISLPRDKLIFFYISF